MEGILSGQPLLFKGGRLLDPVSSTDRNGDLLVQEGKIAAVGEVTAVPAEARVVELGGRWLVPGLIDMHVHLREPGEEYKETIASGTRAAAAGGFTAVACMPNTRPVNDNGAVTALILERASKGAARVYPVGAISKGSRGESLAEFGELRRAGAVAVTDDGWPVTDSQLMRRALEYAGDHDLLVISHAEEPSLSRHGVMNESGLATRLGLRGIPSPAEAIMVYRDLALAAYTSRPVHIAHVSTGEAVALIRRAKDLGWPVTAETAPHYFTLTEEAVVRYNTRAKMNPPLRGKADRAAIRQGLADGTIDVIATDHAPHSVLEKDLEFDRAANGIIGLETALPLSLELVRQGLLTPLRLVELLSTAPAHLLRVAGGSLATGAVADLTVIDPEARYRYSEEAVVSKSMNSPFLGQELQGRAVLTMVGGRITFQAG